VRRCPVRLDRPFQIPRREATDVDVKDVKVAVTVGAGISVTVLRELHLELHLVFRDGSSADRARGSYAGTAPQSVRVAVRYLSTFDGDTSVLTEFSFFHRHWPRRNAVRKASQMPGGLTAGASPGRLRGRHLRR